MKLPSGRRLEVASALLLALTLAAMPTVAAEIGSVAILTPEQGTDFGWNQQGVEACRAAAAAAGVECLVAEGLGYGDVRPTLRELAGDGAGLLIAHASGYNTAAPEIAEESGVPVAIVDRPDGMKPGLVADYTLSGHEGAYLAGRLAARLTRTRTVGIVTSGEPPSWNSQSAAFAEGVRAERPGTAIRYAVIGPAAYSDAAGGKRVTQTVIAAGADIVFGQGDGSSFGMLEAVETTPATDGGKVLFIDVIGDKSGIAGGGLLTSVVWDLTAVYGAMIRDLEAGSFGTQAYAIKLADDSVRLLRTGNIPEADWAAIMQVRDEVVAGRIKVEPHFDAASVRALVTEVAAAP